MAQAGHVFVFPVFRATSWKVFEVRSDCKISPAIQQAEHDLHNQRAAPADLPAQNRMMMKMMMRVMINDVDNDFNDDDENDDDDDDDEGWMMSNDGDVDDHHDDDNDVYHTHDGAN